MGSWNAPVTRNGGLTKAPDMEAAKAILWKSNDDVTVNDERCDDVMCHDVVSNDDDMNGATDVIM